MKIKRPATVKVFASNPTQGDYLPVQFGTNIVVPLDNLGLIANKNFEYGLESLEKDLQLKDLNTVLYYQGALIKYLFQRGVPEYSAQDEYFVGSLVQFGGDIYVATKNISPSQVVKSAKGCNPCNPCQEVSAVCGEPEVPSTETGWCKLVTHCTYDNDMKLINETLEALEKTVKDLKGVKTFMIKPDDNNVLGLEIGLSDDSKVRIPMDMFGKAEITKDKELVITNPDGSKTVLERPVLHKEIDENKGFYWNEKNQKYEVDLADLLTANSGLIVDRNGNISIDPEYTKARDKHATDEAQSALTKAKEYTDGKDKATNKVIDDLKKDLRENGTKVYVDSPLKGDGTVNNHIGLKLSKDFTLDANGNITLANNEPDRFDNGSIKTNNYKLGYHTFTGYTNVNAKLGSLGLPHNWASVNSEEPIANTWDEYTKDQDFDFNGYYIASERQLSIWVVNSGKAWYLENDSGVNSDGSVKDPNNWSTWHKFDNVGAVTDAIINDLREQVKNLNTQLSANNAKDQAQDNEINALKQKLNETCKITVANISSNYTLKDSDNTLISTANSDISVHIPNGIPVGRMFTIIQAGQGKVSITADSVYTVHTPKDGTKTTSGVDAVITILVELNGHVRIFGQTA